MNVQASYHSDVKRMRVPGVDIFLRQSFGLPPQINGCVPNHILVLELSPLPATNQLAIKKYKGGKFFDIRRNIVAVPANTSYIHRYGQPNRKLICCNFEPQWFQNCTGVKADWDLEVCFNLNGALLGNLLMQLANEVAQPRFGSEAMAEGLCTAIAVDLARSLISAPVKAKSHKGRLTEHHLRQMQDFIHGVEGRMPTISELAAQMGVSPRHLTQVFKSTTGQTIHEYLSQLRTGKAAAMLCDTDLSVKEISYRLGFSGPASFCTAFRYVIGETPASYRRRMNKAHGAH